MTERTRLIIHTRTPPGRCQTCGGFCELPGLLSPGPVKMCPWCLQRLDVFIESKLRERRFWATVVVTHLLALACCVATVLMIVASFIR